MWERMNEKSKINNVSKPQKHENYGLSNYLEFNINALVCVCMLCSYHRNMNRNFSIFRNINTQIWTTNVNQTFAKFQNKLFCLFVEIIPIKKFYSAVDKSESLLLQKLLIFFPHMKGIS